MAGVERDDVERHLRLAERIGECARGAGHLDAQEARSIYDTAFLKARLRSGEAYDWYYPSDGARAGQRQPPQWGTTTP